MAININASLTTDEGFEIDSAWGYVNQYFTNDNWANVSYYRSKTSYENGDASLTIDSLPSRVATEITNADFWGTSLAETFTNKCIEAIEAVTGTGTCTIDKSE